MKLYPARPTAALLFCLAFALSPGFRRAGTARAATETTSTTTPTPNPALESDVNRHVKALGEGSDAERRIAQDWLINVPLQALPMIESADLAAGLDADTHQRLTDVLNHLRLWADIRAARDQSQQAEAEWNLRTALLAYDQAGRHNAKWDDLARKAIRQYSSRKFSDRAAAFDSLEYLTSDLRCDDPLILYFDARALEAAGTRETDRQKQGRRVGEAMNTYTAANMFFEKSTYPADRKCFALLRPVMLAYRTTAHDVPKIQADAKKWADQALALWPDVVKVDGISDRFLLDIADLIVQAQAKCGADRGMLADKVFQPLQQALPNSPVPLVMKGRAYTDWAWDARGTGLANTVTPDGWQKFQARLEVAADALQQAYDKAPSDPRAAVAMLRVELGQGRGRKVMEKWFQRAVKADPDSTSAEIYPDNRDAYGWKMEYLQPRWYGTDKDVLEFGRQCLATRNWAGRVTWHMVSAHQELARNARTAGGADEAYYHQPAVWKDIEQVVAEEARFWPNDHSLSDYAYWAWKCGQWTIADAQFKRLGNRLSPILFGSSEVADRARAECAEKAEPVHAKE